MRAYFRADSGLMLEADKSKSEGQSAPATLPEASYWDTGKCPRDDFKRWTRRYLHDVTSEQVLHYPRSGANSTVHSEIHHTSS